MVGEAPPFVVRRVAPDEPEDKGIVIRSHRVGNVFGNDGERARIGTGSDTRQDAFGLLAEPIEESIRLLFRIVKTSKIDFDVIQLV